MHVTVRQARTIDSLYEEVRDADLTLTTEPPLALALDRRVDTPRLGRVAATPRSHVSGEITARDRRQLFIELVTGTDLTWKQAHRSLDLALNCWDQTGRLDAIRDHREFDTAAMEIAESVIEDADSSYHSLAEGRIDDQDVTVIGEDSLTPLDRSVLPEDYATVSPFTGETTLLPEFRVLPSATAIVETLLDHLTPENAEAVGIVLDESTVYSPLVESALEAEGIPYQGGPGFIDDDEIRTFLRLLQFAFGGSDLRVADIRPFLARVGKQPSRSADERRIDRDTLAERTGLGSVLETIRNGTLADALDAYESWVGVRIDRLREELDTLGVLAAPITEALVERVLYYVRSFEVPIERDREGVLLTDGASTAYIDRPVVFYLGLGTGWAKTPPDYPWIDTAEYVQRDLDRFELLLQNGQQQHFLVQESQSGEDVTPCVYFRELFDDRFETFGDLPHTTHIRPDTETTWTGVFTGPETAPDPDAPETISQSTLKRLANSPRDEFFHRLLDTPVNLPMARGTAIHEAAELYVNHPTVVSERRDAVLDAMHERILSLESDHRHPIQRSTLDLALQAVTAYLDTHPHTEESHEAYDDRDHENAIAEALDVGCPSPLTERWFETPDIGVRGFVDLIRDPETLVDYKTGRRKSASDLRKQAAIDPVHEDPNFQAPLYLLQHRRERPDEEISIQFVHLLEERDRMQHGEPPDLSEMVTTVTYLPCTFSEFVGRREVFEAVTDYADSNDRVKALEPLGYERYREFFESHDLPREGVDPERREAVTQAFIHHTKNAFKDTKYVERGCAAAISDMDDLVGNYYLKPDLDAFAEFVDEQLDALAEYRRSGFPPAYGDGGPNWDRVDHRDLILTDEGRQ